MGGARSVALKILYFFCYGLVYHGTYGRSVSVPGLGSYTLHETAKTYSDAAEHCRSKGAYLAVINSKEEEDVLIGLMKNSSISMVYVGVNDIAIEGFMVTEQGDMWASVGYFNWGSKQPTDSHVEQDCLTIHQNTRASIVRHCKYLGSYICERTENDVLSKQGNAHGMTLSNGYITVPGVGSYRFSREEAPYSEAAQICENDNAHLVVINSKTEQDVVINLMQGAKQFEIYVGINDIAKEGNMVTITGQPLEFVKWAATEPNNLGSIEDCGLLDVNRLMNDVKCSARYSFVCEKHAKTSKKTVRSGGYVTLPGVGSYILHEYRLSYNMSAQNCENEGAHLAVINTKEEEDFLMRLLRGSSQATAFIGVSDSVTEGKMVTVLDESWSSVGYSKWAPGEPNNANNGEDCVVIGKDRFMKDVECAWKMAYFCEKITPNVSSSNNDTGFANVVSSESPYTNVASVGSYKLHSELKTYDEATSICVSEGAHLAIINSKKEEDALVDLFQGTQQSKAFIGINDIAVESRFMTVFDKPYMRDGFYNWATGEPRHVSGLEDCAVFGRDRLMRVQKCGVRTGFLCEKTQETSKDAIKSKDYATLPGVGSYILHENVLPYNEAAQNCEYEGAHLAVINTKEEEDFLIGLLQGSSMALIGVSDSVCEGNMMTVLGESWSSVGYSKWATGEPNDLQNNEDCVVIGKDRLLNDVGCALQWAYFCEKSTPEKSSSNNDTGLANVVSSESPYTNVASVGSYKLHSQLKTYDEATSICVNEGAHLAIINSKKEEDALVDLFQGTQEFKAYIGINDIAVEGRFMTVLDEPYLRDGFYNWATGEPLHVSGLEDCVVFGTDRLVRVQKCGDRTGFLCEKTQEASKETVRSKDYITLPGVGSYILHKYKLPYNEAAQNCEYEGAHLAVINTKEEEDFLIGLLQGSSQATAFIGVSDSVTEGIMMTVLGEPWSSVGYSIWGRGEPNNLDNNEDCVVIEKDRLLNDVWCAWKMAYFCEKITPNVSSYCGQTSLRYDEESASRGVDVQAGALPWHVGIFFRLENGTYIQRCGGTLIAPDFVVTAANCFWNAETESAFDVSLFQVAAGHISINLETKEKGTQTREVKELIIPDRFTGRANYYQSDIALVRLAHRLEISETVDIICIDWSNELAPTNEGENGMVAGWGFNDDHYRRENLVAKHLPYVPYKQCWNAFENNTSFRPYITADKLCAGWVDWITAVCPGDSGSGIAFPKTTTFGTRYYLQGIVSVGPAKLFGDCSTNEAALFTDIASHLPFLKQHVNLHRLQTSLGEHSRAQEEYDFLTTDDEILTELH